MKVPSQCCGSIMDDNSSSPSQNHNGPLSGGANVSVANNKHQNSDNVSSEGAKDQGPQYSMPGILHFIQHEWARFELDRSQWELDRAEFQVLQLIHQTITDCSFSTNRSNEPPTLSRIFPFFFFKFFSFFFYIFYFFLAVTKV